MAILSPQTFLLLSDKGFPDAWIGPNSEAENGDQIHGPYFSKSRTLGTRLLVLVRDNTGLVRRSLLNNFLNGPKLDRPKPGPVRNFKFWFGQDQR